jgi:twitching motility protein PilT
VAGKRVLIVHDDSAYTEQLTRAIGGSMPGADVMTALSGPRALGLIGTTVPDVIIVDAELVGMDGYALTQRLKADPQTKDVPVIIVSLSPNEGSALKARQVGAAAHVPATGPMETIVDRINALANGAGAPATRSPGAPQQPSAPAGAPQQVAPSAQQPQTATPSAAPPVAGTGAPQPVSPSGSRAPERIQPPSGLPGQRPSAPSSVGGGVQVGSPGMPAGGDGVPHIDDLLRLMLQRGGSDLHITVGSPPGIRQRGELVPLEDMKPLTPRDTMEMIFSLLSEEQRRRFETELELDFAYSIPGVSRFRANVLQQRNSMGAVFRVIPIKIPTMEELALPKVCKYLAERPRGLVLVTGPTGSGKSTTLAAMINHINATRPLHVITMEDPIEFMHSNQKAYVNQREVGEDTHSFAAALKRVLRQDPDVILVGEMRDLETISAAITAAETGHLVLATLHTTGGPETVDRIIDVFPPHQQQQVRMQLSNTLEGVLSQVLLRSTDGRSRVLAMEIMLGIPAISNLIREGKTHQMDTIIQGGAQLGMQTLDQHLKTLLTGGRITFEEAIGKAKAPRELAAMLGRKL